MISLYYGVTMFNYILQLRSTLIECENEHARIPLVQMHQQFQVPAWGRLLEYISHKFVSSSMIIAFGNMLEFQSLSKSDGKSSMAQGPCTDFGFSRQPSKFKVSNRRVPTNTIILLSFCPTALKLSEIDITA